MYNFLHFMEILNKEDNLESITSALNSIKDIFNIAKIEINCIDGKKLYTYEANKKIDLNSIISFKQNDLIINYYSNKKNNQSIDKTDIEMLLRLIFNSYSKYDIKQKSIDAGFLNINTKLPNSSGFIKILDELANKIDFEDYYSYYINIKGFGLINKLYGSNRGDEAIVSYANKLKEFIDKDEVIAHLGGDNFTALIKKMHHNSFIDLVTMCPIEINTNEKNIIVNLVGIVGYSNIDSINYKTMISNSSVACQYARNAKKLVVKLTPELFEMVNSAKHIERTFKDDLKNGKFVVYYQPKFDIKTGKIIGVEALSRLINDGNVVPPSVFIPILEGNGEIVELDLHVLENLCKDIHNFRNLGNKIVPASCNLSRRDLEFDDIEQRVINIIKKYNVKTEDIVIEVTETTNFEEKERLSKFIDIMHKNGILTSIDDFGTGYSSLSVLRDFKVNEIKIDRSFIDRDELNNSDEIIIGSIIDMAKRLNISVICEGVETKSQADFLIKLGCNKAQGFLYSKPMPKLEFEAMLLEVGIA